MFMYPNLVLILECVYRRLVAAPAENGVQCAARPLPSTAYTAVAQHSRLLTVNPGWQEVEPHDVKEAGYQLLQAEHLEDKLAGCMAIEDALKLQFKSGAVDGSVEIERIRSTIDRGAIHGWAVTDKLCQAVLARLVKEPHSRALPSYSRPSSSQQAANRTITSEAQPCRTG